MIKGCYVFFIEIFVVIIREFSEFYVVVFDISRSLEFLSG